MPSDEDAIRQLVADWMTASQAGDVEKVLSLMTDDVIFLTPGRPPMHKADFAAASPDASQVEFTGDSRIQEIKVLGDWAYLWTELTVTAMFKNGQPPIRRSGHTLSVLRKENGEWRLARDANMLTTVSQT